MPTDSRWRLCRAPGWDPLPECITRFTSFKHHVDLASAREQEAASRPDYDDSAWSEPAVFRPAPHGPLPLPIPREIPHLVRTSREPRHAGVIHSRHPSAEHTRALMGFDPDHPATVQPCPKGAWVTFDFGRPMGGFPELVLEPNGGGNVDVYYGEGALWVMADRLRLPVSGDARYEPLDWRGARYVGLHFHNLVGPVVIRSVKFVEMVYPFNARGDFRCSDPTLTRVWRVCRETAWAGTKDHPVDCLNREQALWIEDICVHGRSMAACFGDVRPVQKAMRQALRVMHDDGVVPVPGPVGIGYQRTDQSLPWSEQPLTIAFILRDLYWFNAETDILEFAMPRLERVYEHFARYEDRRGLLCTNPVGLPRLSLFGGWNPMLKDGVTCAFNFEYAASLAAAAEMAAAVGMDDLARKWQVKSETVRAAARTAFWDPERNLFIDGEFDGRARHDLGGPPSDGKRVNAVSPTANAWAALGGGVGKKEAGAWAEAMRTDAGIMAPVSPYDATTLLDAFMALDLELHARELLHRYYGGIVRNNEPTLPEFWAEGDASGGRYRDDFSRCHPYGTGPAYELIHYVLGARAATPGWDQAVIAPHGFGLSHASGRVPTPHGDIDIRWEREDTSWSLEVVLPHGLERAAVAGGPGANPAPPSAQKAARRALHGGDPGTP